MRGIKRIVGFVMFIAAIILFIAFFMNFGTYVDLFRIGSGFRGFAGAFRVMMESLATPLILFALGLICMLMPSGKD